MKTAVNFLKYSALFLLIILWIYAGLSKLLNYNLTKAEMLNQVFPKGIAMTLAWLVPAVEIITAFLLVLSGTTIYGYCLSFFLLLSFSVYIALGLLHVYPVMPCSCGGILAGFTWGQHLFFNLFFLALTLTAIIIYYKERRNTA